MVGEGVTVEGGQGEEGAKRKRAGTDEGKFITWAELRPALRQGREALSRKGE